MSRTHDNEKKPSQSTFSFKPTASFLQTRGFAPLQTDLDEDAPRRSGYTENLLEKIINQRGTESADTPVQAKPMNRLMKPLQSKRMAIQAKLSIGEPNDKYEKEADATASKVVQQINSPTQEQSVQREAMEEEDEELQMKSLVQRRGDIDGGEASTDLESSIQSARGSGQSLDSNLQAKMGQAMGADFSGVKVHTDSQSDRLNKSIQAKAFTTGQDVFFRQGAYDPNSRGGQELIAHELTHVVQQEGVVKGTQRKENKEKVIRRYRDVQGGAGDICGIGGLVSVLETMKPFNDMPTYALKQRIQEALWLAGSGLGEIFTRAQWQFVANELGINVRFREFGTVDQLRQAIIDTGNNPAMIGVSNWHFPGKQKMPFDDEIHQAGQYFVRAHWVVITDYNKQDGRITYKDQAGSSAQVSLQILKESNDRFGNSFNWQVWSDRTGGIIPTSKKNDLGVGIEEQCDVTGVLLELEE